MATEHLLYNEGAAAPLFVGIILRTQTGKIPLLLPEKKKCQRKLIPFGNGMLHLKLQIHHIFHNILLMLFMQNRKQP